MHDFPCSLEYLRQVAGPRTVPVELGVRYTDEDWSQKLMTLSDFIDKHVLLEVKIKYLFIHASLFLAQISHNEYIYSGTPTP